MSLARGDRGGGSGSGLLFGTGTSIFADNAARNTYFTANPGQLDQYDENEFLLIQVGTGFQRRRSDAWIVVTNVVTGQKGDKGDMGDADEYYVVDANVVTTNSNKDITVTIAGFTAYATGTEIIFHSTSLGANGTAGVRLRANALAYEALVKEDGTPFGVNELEPSTQVRAIYDGTNFVADFARRSQFHYLETADVTRVGDAYTVVDTTIPGTGTGIQIVIGLESQSDNVGEVTLSVNSSTDYPVLLSDGEPMPAGVFPAGETALLVFNTIRAVGWHASNIRPPRSLKGQLVATLDIADGTYGTAENFGLQYIGGWAVESGVTEVGTDNLDAGVIGGHPDQIDNAFLTLPLQRLSTSQLGWFIEFLNGTTVVNTAFINFGDAALFGNRINTDNDDIVFTMQTFGGGTISSVPEPSISFISAMIMTIPTTDDYSVKVYVTEN